MDRISALPLFIVETILCFLPIEEAARTSILSKEWRYKWTAIPKLVFDDSMVKISTEETDWEQTSGEKVRGSSELFHTTCNLVYALRRCRLFSAINQVLLQRKGPIFDFTLSAYAEYAFFEIDQIICHLSRNHPIKRLKLKSEEPNYSDLYELPLSFFALNQLTDLYLEWCEIDHVPISNTFDSLTSLTLNRGLIRTQSLQRLLSICPSLKSLCLLIWEGLDRPFFVMELLKCLPITIEHLTTWSRIISEVALESVSVPQEPPTSLINLKYFRFEELSFKDMSGLTFIAALMKCTPNLEKIEIEIDEDPDRSDESTVILEKYSDVWLEHLSELVIEDFRNILPRWELELVCFILFRSPNLKEVYLKTYMSDKNNVLAMLSILSWFPRASPQAKIVVHNCFNDHDILIKRLF